MSEKKSEMFDKEGKFNFVFGLVTGVAVMSFLLFLVLFIMFASGNKNFSGKDTASNTVAPNIPVPTQPAPTQPEPTEPELGEVRPIDDTDHIAGTPGAPVQIIEYSDFECPYCGSFFNTVEQVLEDYNGKVQIAYRHFPLSFHKNAQKAGEAAECAAEQGKFWPMHDAIFELQIDGVPLNVTEYKKLGRDLALDTTKFETCLDSGKMASKVTDDLAEGSAIGITGTPTSFVNGKPIRGALPYAQVKAMIDAELQK